MSSSVELIDPKHVLSTNFVELMEAMGDVGAAHLEVQLSSNDGDETSGLFLISIEPELNRRIVELCKAWDKEQEAAEGYLTA